MNTSRYVYNPIKDCVFTAKVGDLINMVWPSCNVHPKSSQFQWSLGLKQRYTKHYKTIWFPPSNMEEFSRVSLQPIQGPQTADQQAVIWFHSENHRDTEPFQHIKHYRLYGNPNLWIDPILSQRPPRIQHHSVSFSFPKSLTAIKLTPTGTSSNKLPSNSLLGCVSQWATTCNNNHLYSS